MTKRREWRKVKAMGKPGRQVNRFVDSSKAYILAKELIDESDFTMQQIADCIGITRKMLYVGLEDDKYPWLVLAVFGCLGYDAQNGFNIKTPKGEG